MTDSEKLDLLLSEMVTIKNTMANKDDIKKLDIKIDDNNQDLISRMDNMEHDILNSCLGYTDDQDETIIKKLDNLQATVNTATKLKTIDNDVYNLVNQRIDELTERVNKLAKIS